MNMTNKHFDIILIGGGLAGLSFAIQASRAGRQVLVLEKGSYPRQKVCGEYISKESYAFMLSLGLPLETLNLPSIDTFSLTSPYGHKATCGLSPGGIGISRFLLDAELAKIAQDCGVQILSNSKVSQVDDKSEPKTVKTSDGATYSARLLIGSFGRNSGLQKRETTHQDKYIGIKYHIAAGPPDNTIEIHHFEGGYCGISKVEGQKYCLCYLAKADVFKKYNSDSNTFERHVLMKNPFLKHWLEQPRLVNSIVTSNIQFGMSNSSSNELLTIGDASGFIPPLTGNGMSLAFRSSKKLFLLSENYFNQEISVKQLHESYHKYTNLYLRKRINKGIYLQRLLFINNAFFNKCLMLLLTHFSPILKHLSKQAVGDEI
jgi:flavin-dependent dehydrogenase